MPSCVASSCAVTPSSETVGSASSAGFRPPASRPLPLDDDDRAEALAVDDDHRATVGRPDEADVLRGRPTSVSGTTGNGAAAWTAASPVTGGVSVPPGLAGATRGRRSSRPPGARHRCPRPRRGRTRCRSPRARATGTTRPARRSRSAAACRSARPRRAAPSRAGRRRGSARPRRCRPPGRRRSTALRRRSSNALLLA